jgi:hypothetical protein
MRRGNTQPIGCEQISRSRRMHVQHEYHRREVDALILKVKANADLHDVSLRKAGRRGPSRLLCRPYNTHCRLRFQHWPMPFRGPGASSCNSPMAQRRAGHRGEWIEIGLEDTFLRRPISSLVQVGWYCSFFAFSTTLSERQPRPAERLCPEPHVPQGVAHPRFTIRLGVSPPNVEQPRQSDPAPPMQLRPASSAEKANRTRRKIESAKRWNKARAIPATPGPGNRRGGAM